MNADLDTVDPARDEPGAARDERISEGTNGGKSGIGGIGWPLFLVIGVAILGIGLVNALSAAYDGTRNGGVYRLWPHLFWELSSTFIIAVAQPAIVFGMVRVRGAWLNGERMAAAGFALATLLAFFVVHLAGLNALRAVIAPVMGMPFQVDLSLGQLGYEFQKDCATAALFGIVYWFLLGRRDRASRDRPLGERFETGGPTVLSGETPLSGPASLWLRDGAASLRIDPQDILWVSSAGNYVEYTVRGGGTHLIRTTLSSEEPRLRPFGIVRIHRTRLVNRNRVVAIAPRSSGDFEVRLDSGDAVTGSRRYRARIAEFSPYSA